MSDTPWRKKGSRNMPPCGGCPDKTPGCQDHCEKPEYLAWKKEQARIKKARNDMNLCDGYVSDQIRDNRRIFKWY